MQTTQTKPAPSNSAVLAQPATAPAYWLYVIDWRTRAVDIIAECRTLPECMHAKRLHSQGLSKVELSDFAAYKSYGTAAVTDPMLVANQPFRIKE